MQGQRSAVNSLPELSESGHNLRSWNIGESSSSAAQSPVSQTELARQYGSSNILSHNNGEMNTDPTSNGLFMQNSIPHDHYPPLEFVGRDVDDDDDDDDEEDDDDDDVEDDCRVLDCVDLYRSRSSSERFNVSSSSSEHCGTPSRYLEESDGRRLSCKRKTLEGSVGQASGSGSSSHLQDGENESWHATEAPHHNPGINLPEQVHARLGLSVGEAPRTLSASRGTDNSRRNFRLRINNASHQQDYMPNDAPSTTESVGSGNSIGLSAQRSLSLQPGNNSLDSGPFIAADNGSSQRTTVAEHVPSRRQNPSTRWYRAPSSGASSSSLGFSGERDAMMYEGPITRGVPRTISEHHMFLPSFEMGSSSQSPVNWSLAAENVSNAADQVLPLPRSGGNSPASSIVPNRSSTQYPRRLSDLVRRSMPSSSTVTDPPIHLGPGSSSREIAALPSGSGQGHHGHQRYPRSSVLMERHLGSALGYSTRTLGGASDGRHRVVSEQIRNVLDLMRRGEGLRFEDVMILDESMLVGMGDMDDQHRDMRLDVDNMSYEELLALEERIGDVCTGLNEETISNNLKQRTYAGHDEQVEAAEEPCCVCQEEYLDGDELGTLECGHDFHAECIKQWLMQKNLCPICKTTGLSK